MELNMSKRQINKFYNSYPKYFNDFSREYIKKKGVCQHKDETCKGILTIAHIDQNPQNNELSNILVLCRSHHIRLDQPYHIFSMGTAKKTDNSFTKEKVLLRLETVNMLKKNEINILEAYAGDGVIWDLVQQKTSKKLNILKIEKKDGKKGVYLKGDNQKFLPLFKFSNYDIIDLDAYGVPYSQLKLILEKEFKGFIHVTYIQSGMGCLPNQFLEEIGYTKPMIKKCRTLFNKNGLEKMLIFLNKYGVKAITGFFVERKNYFYINANN
jgi:hypothetical protein